jgi:putative ABC transport system ATP-binding protein
MDHVHKIYDLGEMKVHALRGVSLNVDQGEFVAIMGASGGGKSTFMNIVGCLDRPSKGTYILEGTDVSTLNKVELAHIRNRRIGFVFQGFNLLARTTSLENVELPCVYSAMPTKQRHERAQRALERVGLAGREHHYPSQLSGGQQQRVAIARALVNSPAILLADEPTGNLDSRTSVEIMDIFQDLNDEGITTLMVTHEPDIAAYAKRTVIFKDGTIRMDQMNAQRSIAKEVLPTLPTVEELVADDAG